MITKNASQAQTAFNGVRILQYMPDKDFAAFEVLPDSIVKGIDYKGKINPSKAADELTKMEPGSSELGNINADKLRKLLVQLVKDADMDTKLQEKFVDLINKVKHYISDDIEVTNRETGEKVAGTSFVVSPSNDRM